MPEQITEKRYLTAAQLRQRYAGVSHMWIERRLKSDPTFPRPKRFGSSALRMFDLDQIENWERATCAAGIDPVRSEAAKERRKRRKLAGHE